MQDDALEYQEPAQENQNMDLAGNNLDQINLLQNAEYLQQ